MRFISPYSNFNFSVTESEYDLTTGRPKRIGFVARFQPGIWLEHEREAAFAAWGPRIRRGSRMLDDSLTVPAPLDYRIGVFDTSSIHDEGLRRMVEEKMVSSRKHGRDYLHVEEPRLAAPWPRYDEVVSGGRGRTNEAVALEIAAKVEELGLDPAAVAAYERANRNRPEVLEALELSGPPAKELIEVSV